MLNKNKRSFLDFIKILTRWKNSILLNIILVSIIALIVSFMIPKWYKSTASVLVPQNSASNLGGLSSVMSSLPLSSFGINMGGGNEMFYLGILKSRTMADSVINRFNLQEYYEKTTMEETYISFYTNYEVMLTEENLISIAFEYEDSAKVTSIVNYIVSELQRKSITLFTEKYERNLKFIEERYYENLRTIDSLQIAMENLQKRYGIFELQEQTKAVLTSIADLEAQIIIKKVELEAVSNTLGKDNPQYKQGKIQLENLEKEVNSKKYSNKTNTENPFGSIFLPVDKFPEISKEYTDIYTNLLLEQKLKEYLLPEYESTKMQLLRDKPILQIIDVASQPDYKAGPKRAFIVLGALLVSLLALCLYILIVEHIHWLYKNDSEKYNDIIAIKDSWLSFFKKK